jgi:hypothetical protein
MSLSPSVGSVRPLFGQCARQIAGISAEQLEDCLADQSRTGARLGEILRGKGLLSRAQVGEVLRMQAEWEARRMRPDGVYPAFLSVCLPACNEAENMDDLLDAACNILPELVRQFEVVVVDDGSWDQTADKVSEYARSEPRVRLVRHERNRGYGAAVSTALRAARGDLVFFTDADGQFSLLDLAHLLARLDRQDLVIGYRYRRADSWMRSMNAWGWNLLIRVVLGIRVNDLDCAFKLFRREVVEALHLTATGAAINAEILVQCIRRGYRIAEVPVAHYPRAHGRQTGAALRVIARAFRELPQLWKYRTASPSMRQPGRDGPAPK